MTGLGHARAVGAFSYNPELVAELLVGQSVALAAR